MRIKIDDQFKLVKYIEIILLTLFAIAYREPIENCLFSMGYF